MASSIGSTFTILTGGAIGTDSLAEECAKEWGMHVKLFLAPHHHRVSEKHPAIPHQKLMNRLPFVQTASQRLKRHPSKNPFVRDLLARNWFIVNQAKVLYAYANFEDDTLTTVEGGTGMTVQMCVDHNRDYPEFWKDVFVFDESRQKWYELEGSRRRRLYFYGRPGTFGISRMFVRTHSTSCQCCGGESNPRRIGTPHSQRSIQTNRQGACAVGTDADGAAWRSGKGAQTLPRDVTQRETQTGCSPRRDDVTTDQSHVNAL